jgi:hypothetical protein
MVELLPLTFAAGMGWFAAQLVYLLVPPGFAQKWPLVVAAIVGLVAGLMIPAVNVLSKLASN